MKPDGKFEVGDKVLCILEKDDDYYFSGVREVFNINLTWAHPYQLAGLESNYKRDELNLVHGVYHPPVTHVVQGVGKDAPMVVSANGGKQSHTPYRLDLIDPYALLELGKILHQGAVKYGDENWRLIPVKEQINHALVHIYAYLAGDESDEHLAHAFCRMKFALAVELTNKRESDKHVD